MTTKKLKAEIKKTIKELEIELDKAIEENDDDSENLEKALSFYRDMVSEIEYREGGKKN